MLPSPNVTSFAQYLKRRYLKESDKHYELSENRAPLCSPLHASRLFRCERNSRDQAEHQHLSLTRALSSTSYTDLVALMTALLTLTCGIGSFVIGYFSAVAISFSVVKLYKYARRAS